MSKIPSAQIIDINHNVPPQDIRTGAYELLVSHVYQPAEAVVICVVDPGVGTDRSILLARAGSWWFVAPDNGLLSWVFEINKPSELYRVEIPAQSSVTFHGRDVMAPVAVRLMAGERASSLGSPVSSYVKIPFPVVLKHGSMWQGEVLAVDGFGNLITNVRCSEIRPYANASKLWVEFEGTASTIRGLSPSYGAVEAGKLCAVEGSSGFIEIAVNEGSAADVTTLDAGDRVTFHFRT